MPPSVLTLTLTLLQLSPSFQLTQSTTHASLSPHPHSDIPPTQSLILAYAVSQSRLASSPSLPHKITQPHNPHSLSFTTSRTQPHSLSVTASHIHPHSRSHATPCLLTLIASQNHTAICCSHALP